MIQALPQAVCFFPEAREFSGPISTKSVFRQPPFPWNYPIGSRYHMTLLVGVAVAEPVPVPVPVEVPAIMPRFLFFAPLNFFDSFIFLFIYVKSIKPACATATDKSSLSRPQNTVKVRRRKGKNNIVSRSAAADGTLALQVSPGSSS